MNTLDRTSATVEDELNVVKTRLAEVTSQHADASAVADEAIKAASMGELELSDVREANAEAETLGSLLNELRNQKSTLQAELESAQSAEGHSATVAELKRLAEESNLNLADYEDARSRMSGVIREHAKKCEAALGKLEQSRASFFELAVQLAPRIYHTTARTQEEFASELQPFLDELEAAGADLEAVRANWSGRERSR